MRNSDTVGVFHDSEQKYTCILISLTTKICKD